MLKNAKSMNLGKNNFDTTVFETEYLEKLFWVEMFITSLSDILTGAFISTNLNECDVK